MSRLEDKDEGSGWIGWRSRLEDQDEGSDWKIKREEKDDGAGWICRLQNQKG